MATTRRTRTDITTVGPPPEVEVDLDYEEGNEADSGPVPAVQEHEGVVVADDGLVTVRAKQSFQQIYGTLVIDFVANRTYRIPKPMYDYMKQYPGCFYEQY